MAHCTDREDKWDSMSAHLSSYCTSKCMVASVCLSSGTCLPSDYSVMGQMRKLCKNSTTRQVAAIEVSFSPVCDIPAVQ